MMSCSKPRGLNRITLLYFIIFTKKLILIRTIYILKIYKTLEIHKSLKIIYFFHWINSNKILKPQIFILNSVNQANLYVSREEIPDVRLPSGLHRESNPPSRRAPPLYMAHHDALGCGVDLGVRRLRSVHAFPGFDRIEGESQGQRGPNHLDCLILFVGLLLWRPFFRLPSLRIRSEKTFQRDFGDLCGFCNFPFLL